MAISSRISTPLTHAAYLWNPAVLVWNHSTNTLTERNTFINVDRAIAYGLDDKPGSDHQGGTIRNNFIYVQPGLMSQARKADSDAQILVWDSPGTRVVHNTVLTSGNSSKPLKCGLIRLESRSGIT